MITLPRLNKAFSYLSAILVCLAPFALSSGARADDTLLGLSGVSTDGFGDGDYVIGVAFTPSENLALTEFGVYAGTAVMQNLADQTVTSQEFTGVLYSFTQTTDILGTGTVIADGDIPSDTPTNGDGVAFGCLPVDAHYLDGWR